MIDKFFDWVKGRMEGHITIRVYLRGGHAVDVKCKTCKFESDLKTGSYSSYSFTGLKDGLVSFSIPDIVGVQQVS